jgi:hypothetical protein
VAAYKHVGRELIDRFMSVRKHPGYLSPADASVESVRLAYDEPTYERLQVVKTLHDPRNMVRRNHNIPPRA